MIKRLVAMPSVILVHGDGESLEQEVAVWLRLEGDRLDSRGAQTGFCLADIRPGTSP